MSAATPVPLALATLFADPGQTEGLQLDGLRQALKSLGVESRAWRLYLETGEDLIAPLVNRLSRLDLDTARREVAAFLRLIQAGEMDVPPPRQMVEALNRLRLPRPVFEKVPPYLFRALWKACAQRVYALKPVQAWLSSDVIPLIEWFVRTRQDDHMDGNRRRATWSFYEEHWSDWLEKPACADGTRRWAPVLPRFETGPFLVQEISTEAGLHDEGVGMSHCVASWVGDCLAKDVHIFSIRDRKSAARLATLALQADDEQGWQLIQIKGRQNAAVPTMIEQLAMLLVTWLDEHVPAVC